MAYSIEKARKDFPILKERIGSRKLVYLDSAATSQKPVQVIEAISDFYKSSNANVHRGIHTLSSRATDAYEGAREKVAKFIGAKSPREIVFTKNATESLNLLSRVLPKASEKGPVLSSEMEHHSNIVPWQECGKRLEFLSFSERTGLLEIDAEKISRASIVTLTHASNVLGTINPIGKISGLVGKNSFFAVDGAQSVPHFPVNVSSLGADFLAFSGHKMCGPTGIGVLWGREEILENLDPFLYGGDMISKVHLEKSEWNSLPWKFEAGTPPIAEAVGLGAAVDYLEKIGMERIRKHEERLSSEAMKRLSEIKGVKILGPNNPKIRGGVVSFSIEGMHPHDVSSLLDGMGIAIRAGHHCAEPISEKLGLAGGTARASFYFYNTLDEIEKLSRGIEKARRMFFGK